MTNQHPITPPPELVAKIRSQALSPSISQQDYEDQLVIAAYRAGADQELKACCKHVSLWFVTPEYRVAELRAARRPKPPSLAEKALEALEVEDDAWPVKSLEKGERFDLIRAALKRLQKLEGQADG